MTWHKPRSGAPPSPWPLVAPTRDGQNQEALRDTNDAPARCLACRSIRAGCRASLLCPPLIADVLPLLCFGLRPQIGFAIAEGKRVKPLRGRPHNAKAEVADAKRGRAVVAPRNARARRGDVPRAATDHPVRACIRTDGIG